MEKKKTKEKTIARGYRLRPKTHKLIMRLQKKLNRAADDVLWDACEKLNRQVTIGESQQIQNVSFKESNKQISIQS